ncbi:MAG: glycine oxidase, partial [Gaiellaceae bacterium]|nr:glycine oxidase [Gaiellaceae bacterium]
GATRAAAGVLAPDPETAGFTALARRSAGLWPAFAHELHESTGVDPGYTRCGSLVLAFGDSRPGGQTRRNDMLPRPTPGCFWEGPSAPEGEWLEAHELHALEPGLAADCRGAALLAEDAQVDPRRAVEALCALLGDAVRTHTDVVELDPNGVVLADGSRIEAERVVLAAGAWTARRLAKRLPIVPVKGQTLRLHGPLPATRIIRSEHVYVVPRASGETVIGATIEDSGFDTTVTDEATQTLLRQAIRAVPAVAGLELVEAVASLRPATPDDGPLIGEWEGLLVAGGHYRNGILLAPVTADAVAALLAGDEPPAETAPFDPRRFEV